MTLIERNICACVCLLCYIVLIILVFNVANIAKVRILNMKIITFEQQKCKSD